MTFPILIGVLTLTFSLILQSLAATAVVELSAAATHRGYAGRSTWHNVIMVEVITLVFLLAAFAQTLLWTMVLLQFTDLKDFETALYFSASSFTTVGYGDVVLTGKWRILGPLEAANGLFSFGISTAMMFAIVYRMIEMRVQRLKSGK